MRDPRQFMTPEQLEKFDEDQEIFKRYMATPEIVMIARVLASNMVGHLGTVSPGKEMAAELAASEILMGLQDNSPYIHGIIAGLLSLRSNSALWKEWLDQCENIEYDKSLAKVFHETDEQADLPEGLADIVALMKTLGLR